MQRRRGGGEHETGDDHADSNDSGIPPYRDVGGDGCLAVAESWPDARHRGEDLVDADGEQDEPEELLEDVHPGRAEELCEVWGEEEDDRCGERRDGDDDQSPEVVGERGVLLREGDDQGDRPRAGDHRHGQRYDGGVAVVLRREDRPALGHHGPGDRGDEEEARDFQRRHPDAEELQNEGSEQERHRQHREDADPGHEGDAPLLRERDPVGHAQEHRDRTDGVADREQGDARCDQCRFVDGGSPLVSFILTRTGDSAVSWVALVMNAWNRIATRSGHPVSP